MFSIGGYNTTGTFHILSTISDGQCITFKDHNGALSTSQIVSKATSGKTNNRNSSITLNTNSVKSKYVYVNSMSELMSM